MECPSCNIHLSFVVRIQIIYIRTFCVTEYMSVSIYELLLNGTPYLYYFSKILCFALWQKNLIYTSKVKRIETN